MAGTLETRGGEVMRFFLSYARKERDIADQIRLALIDGRRHTVFFDRDHIPAGESYTAVILQAIRDCERLIFLISPRSVAPRAYAITELRFARERWPHPRGFVLPVLVEPTDRAQIPSYLKAVSIYEPQGDIAAEVAYEVERWVPVDPWRMDIPRTFAAVGAGFQAHEAQFRAADPARRREVAAYFKNIGDCLDAVYESLSRGDVPHGRCAEMADYAKRLSDVVADDIGEDEADELSQLLQAAHEVERFYELNSSAEKAEQLPDIAKAAGQFQGLANAVRAGYRGRRGRTGRSGTAHP
jgi:TIR domain